MSVQRVCDFCQKVIDVNYAYYMQDDGKIKTCINILFSDAELQLDGMWHKVIDVCKDCWKERITELISFLDGKK